MFSGTIMIAPAKKKRSKFVNVLRDVNTLRHKLGIPTDLNHLPKGVIGEPNRCVIARATGACVCGVKASKNGKYVYLTKRLRNFVHAFDDGKYPWLISH